MIVCIRFRACFIEYAASQKDEKDDIQEDDRLNVHELDKCCGFALVTDQAATEKTE